ncbi:hypothetical protein [Burkholderia pseudomallei]|uniref:hypothetical protein n=1 Tax=Burkholderia pseudomallei TaxID=28450 RepID=UPI000F1E4668|nr:hypothetical protein [Burkholderia pseudomallei]CAJ2928789.1 Uncharacterised protein [Burkholderia pseudomallei]VBW57545.1 Uncharacterised protein [Burkholderia pseudomallei]VBW77969.1 Uncharacterised protein [Burkholderia pseudomallei]VBW79796.1 Uncharacterised protein [Burkholderia pseudomallei]VBW79868.1 Uncharacterised protein [Burkholderia pseudomallei]
MPNDNVLTAEARATIMDACRSISRGADGLKAGCAIGDEWPDAEDKAFYDAELRLLARLVALLNDSGQSEPETATVARIEQLRKALFESRDAMRVMSNWAKKSDPAGHSWAVRMVDRANAALNGEPEPRASKCDGSGAVSVSVDDWSECPVCRGAGCQPESHKWDEDGERCERCGDKDWMPDSVCRGRQPEPRAEVTDEPSLTNPLTPYGMLVRALRIVSGTTLMDMADALLTTPAKLSAMEFDREPVTPEFAFEVAAYFDAIGVLHTASALRAAAARTGGQ